MRLKRLLLITIIVVMLLTMLPMEVFTVSASVSLSSNVLPLMVNASTVMFAGQEWWVIGYNGNGIYSTANTATLF